MLNAVYLKLRGVPITLVLLKTTWKAAPVPTHSNWVKSDVIAPTYQRI